MPRRGRNRLRSLIILFIAAVGLYVMVESPSFRLQELAVKGARDVTAEEVWAWSQLVPGEHLLAIRTRDIASILERHPRVESAAVRRRFPGRLEVSLVERDGILLVSYHQGFLEVDGAGWVIAWRDQVGDRPIPVATGLGMGEVAVGERALASGLEQVLLLSKALDSFRSHISEFNYSPGYLLIYTMDGVIVVWGDPDEDSEAKVELLKAFLSNPEPGIRYFDLRVASRPVMGR